MMKKYKIIFYENGVQHTVTITAKNRREALQYAWGTLNLDDVYISEVEYDKQKRKEERGVEN